MARENEDLHAALLRFVHLLETDRFFEAHEVLEEAWHPLRKRNDERRNLAKGLINAAIAFEHLYRNRPKSRRVARQAIGAYERYRPLCQPRICEYDLFRRCCAAVDRLRRERFDI